MTIRHGLTALVFLAALAPSAFAQEGAAVDRVAAVKQQFEASRAAIKHYEWVETTVMLMKGEEKSRTQKRCYYDAEGSLQKVVTSGGDEGGKGGKGPRAKAAANKKAEISDAVKSATALVDGYLPPDPTKIQSVKDAGKLSIRPPDSHGRTGVDLKDYLKPGDQLSVDMDNATSRIHSLAVSSYETAKDKDGVDFKADYKALPDGALYPAVTTLHVKSQGVTIKIETTGYKKNS